MYNCIMNIVHIESSISQFKFMENPLILVHLNHCGWANHILKAHIYAIITISGFRHKEKRWQRSVDHLWQRKVSNPAVADICWIGRQNVRRLNERRLRKPWLQESAFRNNLFRNMFRERAKFCRLYFESVAENAQFYSQPRPLYPRGRVFQISLAWNTKFKARETRSLQTFLHVVTIYYSSKQEELCNQMPKKAVVQCKLVFPAQAGIPIHGFSLLPFLNLIFESNLCLKHFNAVRCHFLTLDRRYTSSLVDCFNGWELFSLSFF